MARRACDGDGLLDAFRAAVANLEAHVDEINGLNVYPVPDGDTGSNMFATVKAALDEAEAVAGQPADRVAAAISFGALMGARGNSGVITSQIFRGMAEGLGGKRRFNGLDLAHALSEGARTAYSAVAKPVEGTILTVIRESAAAAVAAAEHDNDMESVLGATVGRRRAVRRADADPAGDPARGRGRGRGRAGPVPAVPGRAARTSSGQAPVDRPVARRAAAGPKPLDAGRPRRRGLRLRDDVPAPGRRPRSRSTSTRSATTSRRSASRCWSPATRGRSRSTSTTSGRTRSSRYGLALGSLSRISVENLDNQARDVRETRAAAFTGGAEPDGDRAAGARRRRPADAGRGLDQRRRRACRWRSSPSPPATAWPRSSATSGSRPSSRAASPPTRAPASCSRRSRRSTRARSCCCPNNPNVVLAARQVAAMTDRPVVGRADPQRRRGLRRAARPRPDAGRRRPTSAR